MDKYLEEFQKVFGAVKVDYRHDEGKRYYVYGFKHEEEEWDFDKGELLYVTEDEKKIETIKNHIFTLNQNDLFCINCFKKKKIKQLKDKGVKYWGWNVWKGITTNQLIVLQNRILTKIKDFRWRNVKSLTETEDRTIYYGLCSTYCMTEETCEEFEKYNEYGDLIEDYEQQLAAEYVMNGNERDLEHYLVDHIEVIEEGMTFLKRQKSVGGGIIDILAKDSRGNTCVIELKAKNNDKSIVWQSAFYQSAFNEDIRVITIAPGYSSNIVKALNNVKNIELKVYGLNEKGHLQITDYKVCEEKAKSELLLER